MKTEDQWRNAPLTSNENETGRNLWHHVIVIFVMVVIGLIIAYFKK